MTRQTRLKPGAAYRYRFGAAQFDEARFELTVDGDRIDLERRPLEVLAMLLQHAGEVVTKDELLEAIWMNRATVENVLANAVAKLRKGLGEREARRIATQARVGYRFEGAVERIAVGRRFLNRLDLAAGQAAPQRPHFILERQLSGTEGSEVWLARHDKTGERRVYKFSPDGGSLPQLKREATLSRILKQSYGDRDDIVRVIDWNFETAPFFLECEYGGPNLVEWAETNSRLASLSVEERLALALQAVDATVAAHDVGVLHKDLKPSNFLVSPRADGGWQVKIADFGAGGLLDSARFDQFGVTPLGLTRGSDSTSLGTPLYIAPEIIAGEPPTARSDLYALGILIFQILAGDIRKPMTTDWEHIIADPLLREDLAAATRGDAARRTVSAASLAQSLRTLGERRRVLAEREEAERRAADAQRALDRMRARRPWITATIAMFAIGFFASLLLFSRANDARRQAETQTARAEAASGFLSDLLVNADPHQPGGSGAVSIRDALDKAADAIADRFAAAPEAEASVRIIAADIYAGLADYAAAVAHRARAAELYETLYGPKDRRTIEARYRYIEALANASRYDEATIILEAVDKQSALVLAKNPALALIASQARGRLYLMQANVEQAAPELERALSLLPAIDPENRRLSFRLRMDLSQCYSRLGRQEEAVSMLEDLQAPGWGEAGVSNASRASAALYYGAALVYAARYDDAEPALQKAIVMLTDIFGDQSPQVAEAYSALGNLYATSGRWVEAQPVIAAVRERLCRLHGKDHLTCMMATGNEGIIAFQLGEPRAAIARLDPARNAFEQALGPDSPGVHVLGYYLAMAELGAGRLDAADLHSEPLDAARLEAGSPGENWEDRVTGLKALIMIGRGQCAEGAPQLNAAISTMEQDGVQDWILAPYRQGAQIECQ